MLSVTCVCILISIWSRHSWLSAKIKIFFISQFSCFFLFYFCSSVSHSIIICQEFRGIFGSLYDQKYLLLVKCEEVIFFFFCSSPEASFPGLYSEKIVELGIKPKSHMKFIFFLREEETIIFPENEFSSYQKQLRVLNIDVKLAQMQEIIVMGNFQHS